MDWATIFSRCASYRFKSTLANALFRFCALSLFIIMGIGADDIFVYWYVLRDHRVMISLQFKCGSLVGTRGKAAALIRTEQCQNVSPTYTRMPA